MPTPMPTVETPLLSPLDKEVPPNLLIASSTIPNTNNISSSNNGHELHFYNPSTILDISREVAFAYLILLTGGAIDYVPPTALVEVEGGGVVAPSSSMQQQPQSQTESISPLFVLTEQGCSNSSSSNTTTSTTTNLNDESASLAYAAIVDGNVLHACFGLKIAPNGRLSNTAATSKNVGNAPSRSSAYSLFCCFPLGGGASSPTLDALHLVLSNLSSNRTKMQHLAEILREVRELHIESSIAGGSAGAGALYTTSTKAPLHLQVIHAYIHCFTSIVRYHDAKKIIVSSGASSSSSSSKKRKANICSRLLKKINPLSRKKKNADPRLEQLRIDTLHDIEMGFHGLKEDIWESLEKMATETSFTGCASLEESTASSGVEREETKGYDNLVLGE